MNEQEIEKFANQLSSDPRLLQTLLKNMAVEAVRWRTALEEIALQASSEELKESGEIDGDYEEGFDMCVMTARTALKEPDEDKH